MREYVSKHRQAWLAKVESGKAVADWAPAKDVGRGALLIGHDRINAALRERFPLDRAALRSCATDDPYLAILRAFGT